MISGKQHGSNGSVEKEAADAGHEQMIRLLKLILVLLVLGFVGLTGYAYLGDLSPEQSQVTLPVTLDG